MGAIAVKYNLPLCDISVTDMRNRFELLPGHNPISFGIGNWNRSTDQQGRGKGRAIHVSIKSPTGALRVLLGGPQSVRTFAPRTEKQKIRIVFRVASCRMLDGIKYFFHLFDPQV